MQNNLQHNLMPRFQSVLHLWRAMHRSRKGDWRLLEPRFGQFHALPAFRGIQLATDGCVVIAQREDESFIEGHITNWYLEKVEKEQKPKAESKAKPQKPSPILNLLLS